MRRIGLVARTTPLVVLALVAAATLTPSMASAGASAPAACDHPTGAPTHGQAAVDHLGSDGLAAAGYRTNRSADRMRTELLEDPTMWIDSCGMTFYVDPAPEFDAAHPLDAAAPQAAPFPYAQTFTLHSKAGSNRTIYLDFTGYQMPAASVWAHFDHNDVGWTAPPFDTDSSPGTFSNSEQDQVQAAWQRVAEDYAPFDVDVTTQDPGAAAINRSSSADQVYGTRALITEDTVVGTPCGCGGVAYLRVFNDNVPVIPPNYQSYYQPALVFAQNLGQNGRVIGEAAAHEVGHNFGLSHDGVVLSPQQDNYYEGQGSWAPIMGVGYYRPITQWSKGEYSNANQTQDDLAIIATGAPVRSDDYGNTFAAAAVLPSTATSSTSGVISTRADKDVFHFQASGPTMIHVSPAPAGPDLDIRADLFDSTGAPVTFSDPPAATVSQSVASGLDATISMTLPTGTYYLQVDGVGFGNVLTTGYTDYASLGAYTVDLSTTVVPPTVPAAPPAPTAVAADGQATVSWTTPTDGGAPIDHYVVTPYVGSVAQAPFTTSDATTTAAMTGLTNSTPYTFTVMAHNSAGNGLESPPSSVVTPLGPMFHAIVPARIIDSRPGGAHVGSLNAWGASVTQNVQVTGGLSGVPANATAVVLNVTATGGTANGDYLTIWPAGAARPTVSSLNFNAGQAIANQVTVKVGTSGQISIFNAGGTTSVIVDVNGYYDHTTGGDGFTSLAPQRLIDSRPGAGHTGPLNAWVGSTTQTVTVGGLVGVPSDADAVVLNVTATGGSSNNDYLSIWPAGEAQPTVSSLNVNAGQTIPNAVTVKLGTGGSISIFNAAGTQHVIVDVAGYFKAGTGKAFYALAPARIIDSRPASQVGPLNAWTAGATQDVATVSLLSGVPSTADSVVLNVTAIAGTVNGDYLTIWPQDGTQSIVSSLNFNAGDIIANAVTAKVSGLPTTGRISVFNAGGVVNVTIDVAGYYA